MTQTHLIQDRTTGRIVGTVSLPDSFTPALLAGQVAVNLSAGQIAAGTISGTGGTTGQVILGDVVFALSGTFTGVVQLERSFDGGTTWIPVRDEAGALIALAVPGEFKVSETEGGTLYRLNCTALSAGTIAWQVGR